MGLGFSALTGWPGPRDACDTWSDAVPPQPQAGSKILGGEWRCKC